MSQDWQMIETLCQTPNTCLLIYAGFALHHIRPVSSRTGILEKLKALNPQVFVMIEPYSDHICLDLKQRFLNAWHHYGLTFQAIDRIEAPQEEKQTVKTIFFGNEIQDVLGT